MSTISKSHNFWNSFNVFSHLLVFFLHAHDHGQNRQFTSAKLHHHVDLVTSNPAKQVSYFSDLYWVCYGISKIACDISIPFSENIEPRFFS